MLNILVEAASLGLSPESLGWHWCVAGNCLCSSSLPEHMGQHWPRITDSGSITLAFPIPTSHEKQPGDVWMPHPSTRLPLTLSPRSQPEGPPWGCRSSAFSTVYSELVNKTPKHLPPTASRPQKRGRGGFPPLSISHRGWRNSCWPCL